MDKSNNFPAKHPKWDQNLQFTTQNEMKSIPVTFIWETLPPAPRPLLKYS